MPDAPLILLVEDEPNIRDPLDEFLQERGYRLAIANGFSVAAEILRALRPHLIIADVVLRDGSGATLANEARALNIPVLLMSGEPAAIARCQDLPIPFLQKPFRLAELMQELERLLPDGGAG